MLPVFFLKVNVHNEETETESENDDEEDIAENDAPQLPQWRTPHNTHINAYPEWQGLSPSDDVTSPLEYFRQLFSEDIPDVTVQQSNIYTIQCDPTKPLNLTTKELEQFLCIVMFPVIVRFARHSHVLEQGLSCAPSCQHHYTE